jgi:acyl carrier protein
LIDGSERNELAEITCQLTAWVVELMPGCDGSEIDKESSLAQYPGFDSIAIVQLLAKAEDEFRVELADQDETIESVASISSLAQRIVQLGGRPQ